MSNIKSFINNILEFKNDDPFYVFNVEDVILKHRKWLEVLPRVTPYYAIKANRFPVLLQIMIALGLKFESGSRFEMGQLMYWGGHPNEIVLGNPSKSGKLLEYTKNNGIDLMAFDNEEELFKIKTAFPEARLLLRIKVNDSHSNTRLNLKFGADIHIVEELLLKAKDLTLNVVGVAFHVGSGCLNSHSYVDAIQTSRIAFNMASNMGFHMTILDIGGGFPGSEHFYYNTTIKTVPSFEEIAEHINDALNQYYPEEHLTIIAEPGRYYCESAFTLITKIITKTTIDSKEEKTVMYYLNDSTYLSFMDSIIEKKVYEPIPHLNYSFHLIPRKLYNSMLWGATCDSHDLIRGGFQMPEMFIGEHLLFEDMGAYSMSYTQFGFNGLPSPIVTVFVSEFAENILNKTEIWPKIESYLADIKWRDIYLENNF